MRQHYRVRNQSLTKIRVNHELAIHFGIPNIIKMTTHSLPGILLITTICFPNWYEGLCSLSYHCFVVPIIKKLFLLILDAVLKKRS